MAITVYDDMGFPITMPDPGTIVQTEPYAWEQPGWNEPIWEAPVTVAPKPTNGAVTTLPQFPLPLSPVDQISPLGTIMPLDDLYAQQGMNGTSYPVTQTALPVAGALVAAGTLTLGLLKNLLAKYGATILKTLIGAAAFKEFMDMLLGGKPDTAVVKARGKKKRYSIGANPRLNTLLKVAKRVDNIFVSYDKRISKFRTRVKGPRRRTSYRPMGYYLSPAERKQLRG